MKITLYRRTFPAPDAPVGFSFVPFVGQKHTLTVDGVVYEAEYTEVVVAVPDDAKYDPVRQQLNWRDGKRPMYSKARDVLALAKAGTSGFKVAK